MSEKSSDDLKMSKLTDMTGKVALVTGGGTGIGLMIAKGLASNGAKVYISGRRFEVLEKAAQAKFDGEGKLVPLKMDVTDKSSIISVVESIGKADGKLDILVNNAGIVGPKRHATAVSASSPTEGQTLGAYGRELFDSQSFEDWGALARANVASLFFVTTAFLGLLEASTHGREGATASVINISSTATHMKLSFGSFAYACLKAATTHFTKVLATELSLKRAPIRVNAIAPGTFPSELTPSAEKLKEFTKMSVEVGVLQAIPARRAGREEEMAALAVYLASPASSYTHGQEIVIDGGLHGVNP